MSVYAGFRVARPLQVWVGLERLSGHEHSYWVSDKWLATDDRRGVYIQ
jgi:hypothetical protein